MVEERVVSPRLPDELLHVVVVPNYRMVRLSNAFVEKMGQKE